jgi:hypothetical protein
VLYPHVRGPPCKNALRHLAKKYLGTTIQQVGKAGTAEHGRHGPKWEWPKWEWPKWEWPKWDRSACGTTIQQARLGPPHRCESHSLAIVLDQSTCSAALVAAAATHSLYCCTPAGTS